MGISPTQTGLVTKKSYRDHSNTPNTETSHQRHTHTQDTTFMLWTNFSFHFLSLVTQRRTNVIVTIPTNSCSSHTQPTDTPILHKKEVSYQCQVKSSRTKEVRQSARKSMLCDRYLWGLHFPFSSLCFSC